MPGIGSVLWAAWSAPVGCGQGVLRVKRTGRETARKALPREQTLKWSKCCPSPCIDVLTNFTLTTRRRLYKYIFIDGRTALPKHFFLNPKLKKEQPGSTVQLVVFSAEDCWNSLQAPRGQRRLVKGGWGSLGFLHCPHGAAPESPFPGRTKDGTWVSPPRILFLPTLGSQQSFSISKKISIYEFSDTYFLLRVSFHAGFFSPLWWVKKLTFWEVNCLDQVLSLRQSWTCSKARPSVTCVPPPGPHCSLLPVIPCSSLISVQTEYGSQHQYRLDSWQVVEGCKTMMMVFAFLSPYPFFVHCSLC